MSREENDANIVRRHEVAVPPRGFDRLRWYGPGLLWMVSSVGSGSVLFTPRVGSRYGYVLLWTALLVGFLTWVMIREIGRWTVVSGRTILEGYRDVPGPHGWAVWLIFLPGLVSGITVVAGSAARVGRALMIACPGPPAFYPLGVIRRRLPADYRPGLVWTVIMAGVGLFYGFYAVFFYYDLLRGG